MTGFEFSVLILWVMVPPWLLGAFLLWHFKRGVLPQAAFLLLTLSIAGATLVFAPQWLSRLLGVHDLSIMGISLLFSPLGLVSAFLAWLLASLFTDWQRARF